MPFAKRVVAKTLAAERAKRWTVGVLFTNNKKIRVMNKKFLNHDAATDVISFGLGEGVGDIAVSVEMARQMARKLKISFKEELARYLVHGTLHLLGYRDKKKKDKIKMHARQERILKSLR